MFDKNACIQTWCSKHIGPVAILDKLQQMLIHQPSLKQNKLIIQMALSITTTFLSTKTLFAQHRSSVKLGFQKYSNTSKILEITNRIYSLFKKDTFL